MPLTRNSGCKDTAFLLIDQYFFSFSLIYNHLSEIKSVLRVSPWITKQDSQQCAYSHCEWIIKVADDTDRGNIC